MAPAKSSVSRAAVYRIPVDYTNGEVFLTETMSSTSKWTAVKVATLLALLPVIGGAASAPKPRNVKPALWLVEDVDTKIYLFGTVHALKPGLLWFDEAVKDAFDRSESVVIEMIAPGPTEARDVLTRLATNEREKTLGNSLSGKDRDNLQKAMVRAGLPKNGFDGLEPWAAAIQLQVALLAKENIVSTEGVEPQLRATARVSRKKVTALETYAQQLGFLDGLPIETQLKFFNAVTAKPGNLAKEMDQLVEFWAKPDPEGFAKLTNKGFNDAPMKKVLITDRNVEWTDWIANRMKQPGTTFMAVGAAHLAGRDNVRSLLEARGYRSVRIKY